MPVSLPPLADLAGSGTTPTSDTFRTAIGQLRIFLAEKLGVSGSNSDAQTALGGGTVGKVVFGAATTDPALNALGGSTLGKDIFKAASDSVLTHLLGAGSIAGNPSNLKFMLGQNHQMQISTSVVTTNASGLATITFPEEFLNKNGNPVAASFAMVALGDTTAMSPIAAVQASYTSTTMQIKCAASVLIRVNWLAIASYPTEVIPQ